MYYFKEVQNYIFWAFSFIYVHTLTFLSKDYFITKLNQTKADKSLKILQSLWTDVNANDERKI